MNLKSRIERIEQNVGARCLGCGADRQETEAFYDRMRGGDADEIVAEYRRRFGRDAGELLSQDAPAFARACGFNPQLPPWFCQVCGAVTNRAQHDADLRAYSKNLLEQLTAEYDNDRDIALKALTEVAPTLARYAQQP